MEQTKPLVIFRTVAHNAEATIARAIESVYAQNYDNWELHLVNNGSTDGTGGIMAQYSAKDPRVKVFTNEGNWVWKKGNQFTDYYKKYDLNNSFLCSLDADDEYEPDFLEKMLPFACDNSLDIAACGNKSVVEETNKVVHVAKIGKTFIIEGEGFDRLFPVYHFYMRTRWAKLFRLTVTDKIAPERIFHLPYGDDTVEALEYYRNADRVGIYPDALYRWYRHKGSVSHRWDNRRNESNRIVHDLTVNYLMEKVGYISPENNTMLREVYSWSVIDSADVIMQAELEIPDRIAALHDALTSRHTRELLQLCSAVFDNKPKIAMLTNIVNWICSNEEKLDGISTMKKAMEILVFAEQQLSLASQFQNNSGT